MKKMARAAVSLVFSFALLFILLITSVEAVCYWIPGYYRSEFEKYDVPSILKDWRGEEMEMDQFLLVIGQTMLYLRGGRENLIVEAEIDGKPQEFYNENEKSHMADVRDLFVLCVTLRTLAVLGCLAILGGLLLLEHGKAFYDLGRAYLAICLLILLAGLLAGILASQDFTKYFTFFHQIFFSQGNWLFDPRESRMIDMLPEGFFSDTALRILLSFLGSALLLLLPSLYSARHGKAWGYGREMDFS